jgi:hypothetical protein
VPHLKNIHRLLVLGPVHSPCNFTAPKSMRRLLNSNSMCSIKKQAQTFLGALSSAELDWVGLYENI